VSKFVEDAMENLARYVIRASFFTHLGLWRERRGNERGTAPLEEPAPGADLVYEPVDDS
jgi:hypothetical protein